MLLSIIVNILLLLIIPPIFIGIINKTKAIISSRIGASIFQPFYDILKLFKKSEVISYTTSFVFKIAPTMTFASVLFAGLLIPIGTNKSLFSFEGDFILFAYIIGLGKFFSLIGAMDTGSSFEGMGASREATFSSLVEPAFFIIISSVAYLTGYKSFSDIFYLLQKDNQWNQLIIALSVITLFIMMLVEGSRVPVDDPNTHLELTMIHEVMVLDNSGPDFAFILYAGAMKLVVIGSIIANLVVPFNLNPLYSFLIFVGILFILAVSIGLIESLMARLRMTHVPQFILTMTSISLLVLAFIVFGIGGLK